MAPPERDTQQGLLVAPSLDPTLERDHVDRIPAVMDRRDTIIAAMAVMLAFAATATAEILVRAIAFATNLAYYGRVSFDTVSPAGHRLGVFAVLVPVIGGVIVGIMARYGSRAIRGHGIPEAMEQILTNESRIPIKMTFLKPASAAVAIGTGGPFGAEGPIIATGGALGSGLGQLVHVSTNERKTLLAAGAAAGMTAIFGTPIAAVLIAIELLLFEYRARSIVPVALAAAAAGGLRVLLHGDDPVFAMPDLAVPNAATTIVATLAAGLIGVAATYITKLVYAIEDGFEKLPIHWMWWPALGAVAVGLVGLIVPKTLGVGYDNIEIALAGGMTAGSLAALCFAKFVSWSIALGSGTSGGTLAPLLTLGSSLGWLIVAGVAWIAPHAGIDPRVGALVGMTAMFAGSARALLASIVFALEATHQIHAVVPIVSGVTLAYFASCLLMKTTIMTEKLARRGVAAAGEYDVDPLAHARAIDVASREVKSVRAEASCSDTIAELAHHAHTHQAYPVLDHGRVIGVVTRKAIFAADAATRVGELITRPPIVARDGDTARDVVQRMASARVGRIVLVDDDMQPIGIATRSDIVAAFGSKG